MGVFSQAVQAFQDSRRLSRDSAAVDREVMQTLAHATPETENKTLPPVTAPKSKNIDFLDVMNQYKASLQGDTLPVEQDPRNRMTVGNLTFSDIRTLSHSSLISSIISTRLNQIAEFTVPQKRPGDIGFRIELKDPTAAMTPEAHREALRIQDMILTCGDPDQQENPNFEHFTRVFMRDSLTYDQGCAEILLDREGRPAAWIPIDASTIRRREPTERALSRGYQAKSSFVQVLDNREVAKWTHENFLYFVRRGTTDMHRYGYGYSEIEEMCRSIINFMNAEDYNAANFTSGVHAAGLLMLMSNMSPEKFRNLDDDLRTMMTGPRSAHRYIMAQLDPNLKEEMKHIPLSNNNKDMEYSEWLGYNIKINCAAWQMDPAELGIIFGNEGQSNSLNTAGPAERVAASKERGLRPILRQYQHMLNVRIVRRINPAYQLVFDGFDTLDPSKQADLDYKRLTTYMSINELRAEKDLPLVPLPLFDIPGGAAIMSLWANQQQQAQQAPAGGGPGASASGASPAGSQLLGDDGRLDESKLPPHLQGLLSDEAIGEMYKSLNLDMPDIARRLRISVEETV
jgi:hypothetical protein